MSEEVLTDRWDPAPVRHRELMYAGLVWDVRRDRVDLGSEIVERDVVAHPGAVAILALDEQERVALVCQYRHPVGMRLWEVPAGLLDIAGEDPLTAARRELAEEADLDATDWAVLADYFTSPGFTSEAIRVYLARGLSPVPMARRHQRTGEERDMPLRWVPLASAHEAVLDGRLHNPHTVIAILAGAARRERGWAGLRPADAPWRRPESR